MREALDQWIERRDRQLRRDRETLETAGIFDRVWARLRITGPFPGSARQWAMEAGIDLGADAAIETALGRIIRNGH